MNTESKSIPSALPNAVITAVIRPQATARAITNITLGPGTKIIATEARTNCVKFWVLITLKA
jgi:hypothetical protein